MEASAAAARLIEDYKGRKRRLGSQKASRRPAKASRRPSPLLLLPLLLIPCAWIAPSNPSKGFATTDDKPLAWTEVVLTAPDGSQYKATTNEKGDFSLSVPEGTYSATLADGTEGPKNFSLAPGISFRLPFPKRQ